MHTVELVRILKSRSLRMVGVLLLLWIGLALHPDTREAFLTAGNFSNLTAQIAEIVIIGVVPVMTDLQLGCTPEVTRALPALADATVRELRMMDVPIAWRTEPARADDTARALGL